MYTYGTGIYPYTKVIPPSMFLAYASYDDNNGKSNRDRDYEPEDNDNNVLEQKNFREVLIFIMPLQKQIFFCWET